MDEEIKINFSKPMLVLKIRETYKAPYHKNKFITVRKVNCESPAEFKRFMHQFTGNWSSGSYDIQFVLKEGNYIQNTIYSTLVRIDIREGKIVKLWKASPYTKTEYPIWTQIKENKLKIAKKQVVKKKPVKKVIKKKVLKKKKKPERGKQKVIKKKPKLKKKLISKTKIAKKKRPTKKIVRKPKKKVTKRKIIKKKPVKKKQIKRRAIKKKKRRR
jgi:hypothetical protein